MKRTQLLAALESVRAWAKELPDEVEPFRIQPIPGLVVVVREGRSSNALKCERYRATKKARATRVAIPPDTRPTPVSDTVPTRVTTGVKHESQPVSDTAANPSLGFPLASPSGSLPSDPKESAVASEGSDRFSAREPEAAAAAAGKTSTSPAGSVDAATRKGAEAVSGAMSDASGAAVWTSTQPAGLGRDWSKQPPRNLEEAREMPLRERCELALRDPVRAQWVEPHQWPEVRLAVASFRAATKKPNLRVGTLASDAGVRRLLELYAAGCTADEVCTAIPAVVESAWWRSGDAPRDLGSITLTVVRRALAERAPAENALAGLPRQMFGGAT